MLKITPIFILGISMGYRWYGVVPMVAWLCMLVLCFGLSLLFSRKKMAQSILVLLVSFCLGGTLLGLAYVKVSVTLPQTARLYNAVLLSEPRQRGKVLQCDMELLLPKQPLKIKASFYHPNASMQDNRLHIGQGVEFWGTVQPPINFASSKFDYAGWLRLHDFHGEVFLLDTQWQEKKVGLSSLSLMERTILKAKIVRQRLIEKLGKSLSREELGMVSAMALGDKSLLSKELKEDYSSAGVSHILALSGLHLSILYAIFLFLFSGIQRVLGQQKGLYVTDFFLLITIWGYVFLVGLSPSVIRAASMLTLYTVIRHLQRKPVPLNNLAFIAFLLLLIDPLALFDIGFQLSFMAVLFILLLYKPCFALFNRVPFAGNRLYRAVASLAAVSLAAQIGTAPLVAFYFGRLPLYFLLSNFIAIPCTTIILYAGVFLFVFSWIPKVVALISSVITFFSAVLNTALHHIANFPYATISLPSLSLLQVFFIYLSLFLLYILMCFYLPMSFSSAKK